MGTAVRASSHLPASTYEPDSTTIVSMGNCSDRVPFSEWTVDGSKVTAFCLGLRQTAEALIEPASAKF
jgi:hypothetical protein